MQPNYNAGFAFEFLSPYKGIVNASRLHAALRNNLKINLVEKDVVMDIIERLAYINEQELLLSDMIFFEPTKEDESYFEYRKNFSQDQDESDSSWHSLYRSLWKALINTVKQRRIIQEEMCLKYPNAIDYMFQHYALNRQDKLGREDFETFLQENLGTKIDQELLRCIMQSLDRDQDNLVSYQEL